MHVLKVFRSPNLYLVIVPALQIVLELTDSPTVNLKEKDNSSAKIFQTFKECQYYEGEIFEF